MGPGPHYPTHCARYCPLPTAHGQHTCHLPEGEGSASPVTFSFLAIDLVSTGIALNDKCNPSKILKIVSNSFEFTDAAF